MRMPRVNTLLIVLVVLMFILGLTLKLPEPELVQYDFIITVHNGIFDGTIYYSDDPPLYGPNTVMFVDAVTGLMVVEIAPRITVRSTMPGPKPIEKKKNKVRRYLL